MISHLVRTSVVAVLCVTATAATAPARTPYDGAWSVVIVTQRGSCDRAYRYGVQIVNGNVIYEGGLVNMTGRVAANGIVRVTVSSGSASANGLGRLFRNTGRGNWVGRSGSDACSGYWEAERRG